MKHAHLATRPVLTVFVAGLVLSALVSVAFSLGCAPIVGAIGGALLGLINFASLYQFGVRILNVSAHQSTVRISGCNVAPPDRPNPPRGPSMPDRSSPADGPSVPGRPSLSSRQSQPDRRRMPNRPGTSVLGNVGIRLATVVAGMAAITGWFGVGGLLSCAGMLFAVQVPLFASLAAVAKGRAADYRLIWRQ